jgi:hypothetical protein
MRNRTSFDHRHPRRGGLWSRLDLSVPMGAENKPRGKS